MALSILAPPMSGTEMKEMHRHTPLAFEVALIDHLDQNFDIKIEKTYNIISYKLGYTVIDSNYVYREIIENKNILEITANFYVNNDFFEYIILIKDKKIIRGSGWCTFEVDFVEDIFFLDEVKIINN